LFYALSRVEKEGILKSIIQPMGASMAKGKIITVAQQKGGAGKTTLVVQLATAFLAAGKKVATIDIDPQASLSQWFTVRSQNLRSKNLLLHSPVTGWRMQAEVDRLAKENDIVLIDSPPHTETDAKISIRAADLVIIPVQPSPVDIWATKPTLEICAKEKVPVKLVLNRVAKRSKLAKAMLDKLSEYGAEIATTQLGNRIKFAEGINRGLGVVEMGKSSLAYQEVIELANEIAADLDMSIKLAA
jgi:chromosome partitioning protein